MAHVILLYGTTEGQTAKIAQHVASVGSSLGHAVDVRHAAELEPEFSIERYAAAILGASVHEGRHQAYLVAVARAHAAWLAQHPSAFFSVCLAMASSDPQEQAAADALIDRFAERTGWAPAHRAAFAGALRYSQYNWLKRMVMKQIAKKEGGSTDTSRDHEYTDWDAVTAWSEAFFRSLGATA